MWVPPRSRMMMIAVLCRAATTCATPANTTATADRSRYSGSLDPRVPMRAFARQCARPGGGSRSCPHPLAVGRGRGEVPLEEVAELRRGLVLAGQHRAQL